MSPEKKLSQAAIRSQLKCSIHLGSAVVISYNHFQFQLMVYSTVRV